LFSFSDLWPEFSHSHRSISNFEPRHAASAHNAVMVEQTTDRRVQFDFEITFSNGGGLQGQGFRLDLHQDDISDADLAEYLVRDMRLLMVQDVRILNKKIIFERHKRPG
jgi:arylformamidase